MVVFGLILLLIGLGAGAFATWVATNALIGPSAAGTPALGIGWFGNMLQIAPITLVLLGLASGLLSLLGLWVMLAAGKRKARAAKERRDLTKQQKRQEKELAETRTRLADTDGARRVETGRPVRDGETYRPADSVETQHVRPIDEGRDGTLR